MATTCFFETSKRRPNFETVSVFGAVYTEMAETVGDRIKLAAEMVGTQDELASRADIPLRTLTEYINGRKVPLERAAAIARAAGLSLDWLATGEGHRLRTDLPLRRFKAESDTGYETADRLKIGGLSESLSALDKSELLDNRLLIDVLARFETLWRKMDVQAPALKKAEVFAFCYRACLRAGNVDERLMEDVVALVRSPQ